MQSLPPSPTRICSDFLYVILRGFLDPIQTKSSLLQFVQGIAILLLLWMDWTNHIAGMVGV